MQWILQEYDDTLRLAEVLERLGLCYSFHKVVPFVGTLFPEPEISDPASVVLFGSYSLWRTAEARRYRPGVFKIEPFVHEAPWQPYLLNGCDAIFMPVRDIPERLTNGEDTWFMRPVDDSKVQPGGVKTTGEILGMARKVLALDPDDIPEGALRHDTVMMFTKPAHILKEWRLWAVGGRIVTYSLYKEGARVVYRPEVDDDALAFGQKMVDLNPGYARAYVIDICRTAEGLRLLETNCLNAAGFYAADLMKLAIAIEGLPHGVRS